TLREDPADAEAVSHKLLMRGGFIRQVGAGLWTYLPLGWRVHRKVEQIIREELDAFGAQEILMPVLTPAELWEATGRVSSFERCGLEALEVAAESGIMGGSGSRDFLAPAGSGENTLVRCENGDYAADLEIADGVPPAADFPEVLGAPEEVETPGQRTIEDVSTCRGVDPRATAKAMPVVA